jgi:alpha-tubulin suppressor-like RCC1 family protein
VWTWGNSTKGQLGLGVVKNCSQPQEVAPLSTKGIIQVAAGETHMGAVSGKNEKKIVKIPLLKIVN